MSTDNAREMLLKAELTLADGNFLRARKIAQRASTLVEKTQGLHREFIAVLKKMVSRLSEMEDKGYDITEAQNIVARAKNRAVKSDYESAIDMMKRVDPALDRATYLPFPLLNKTLDIVSTIQYMDGKINYSVRIENPMSDPLGEIIIRPFLSEGDFNPVQERYFGVIGPREYKESTFTLVPKTKDWNLGVGREVLMGEGVVLRTKLSSKGGTAKYYITIENNSDQIIRDIRVAPMAPGGLGSEPASGTIEFVEPFASKMLEFNLFPVVLERPFEEDDDEKVVVIEEEDVPGDNIIDEDEDWSEEVYSEEEEEAKGIDLDLDGLEDEDIQIPEGPRDFTPVEEEYNLISMVPPKYPEDVEKEMLKRKRRK
jgi:hypothetical protein